MNWSATTALPFRVIDAEYSRALDSVIVVDESPNTLRIISTATQQVQTVALNTAPECVSVSPDGHKAAVGHNGWISYVDLDTATLLNTLPISIDVLDVVLAGNGYVYGFPRVDQWTLIHALDLSNGNEVTSTGDQIYAGTLAKLQPGGTAMYGADNGLSPDDIEKYSISGGTPSYMYQSPYWGDYPMGGNLWFSDDGARIFTRGASVFRTSTLQTQDMIYAGSFPNTGTIAAADDSTAAGFVAEINEDPNLWDPDPSMPVTADVTVQLFERSFLNLSRTDTLPSFPGTQAASHGRFVFWSSDGMHYYVLVQADPSANALNDWALLAN